MTVRSYMAHHQGMSLLALDYLLRDRPMQRRFLSCPLLKAADLLLQERVPQTAANVLARGSRIWKNRGRASAMRKRPCGSSPTRIRARPKCICLSNGRYHVVISSAGGGYSRWRRSGGHALARRRDPRLLGHICLPARRGDGRNFGRRPISRPCSDVKSYEAIFTQARAEFRQRHAEIEIHTEISVSPEDDVELRRVTLTNHSSRVRDDRVDELRRGRAGGTGGRRGASGLQQSVRANRICARGSRPFSAPAARAPRTRNRPGCCI